MCCHLYPSGKCNTDLSAGWIMVKWCTTVVVVDCSSASGLQFSLPSQMIPCAAKKWPPLTTIVADMVEGYILARLLHYVYLDPDRNFRALAQNSFFWLEWTLSFIPEKNIFWSKIHAIIFGNGLSFQCDQVQLNWTTTRDKVSCFLKLVTPCDRHRIVISAQYCELV